MDVFKRIWYCAETEHIYMDLIDKKRLVYDRDGLYLEWYFPDGSGKNKVGYEVMARGMLE